MKDELSIRQLCDLLEVAPSGYYRWLTARPSARHVQDGVLTAAIIQAHGKGRGNYGSPRIVQELREHRLVDAAALG